jgi:hypothetical protein
MLLENYFLTGDLEAQVAAFVAHDNHQRYHESQKKSHPGRCLHRPVPDNPVPTQKDQKEDDETTVLAARHHCFLTQTKKVQTLLKSGSLLSQNA